MGKPWDVEIAAAGRWNSSTAGWVDITRADLKAIADAFVALKDTVKPMLKLGHNNKQPLINASDGQPALGWVSALKLVGDKLVATFNDVPEVLHSAIKSKRYSRVSVELDRNVKVAGGQYPWVLSAVGLLGADIPAINTLADLQTYMESAIGDEHIVFTNFETEEANMADEAKIAELTAKLEAAELRATTAEAAAQASEAKFTTLQAEVEQEKEAAAFTAATTNFTARCEALVKAGAMLPAQREKMVAQFNADNAETLTGTLDIIAMSAPANDGEQAHKKAEGEVDADPSKQVAKLARAKANSDNVSFTVAMERVLQEDAELAQAYRDAND